MSDLNQKYVITPNGFFYGRVLFHRQLGEDALSGGWWFYDKKENTVYLYGSSFDFGQATIEQIDEHEDEINEKFRGATVVYIADSIKSIYDILKGYVGDERALDLVSSNDFV